MKKVTGLLIYLGLGFALPLIAHPTYLLNPKIILLMITCTVVVLTQPSIDPQEAKVKYDTDRNSFWAILILSLIGLIAPIIEWAYINHAPSNWTLFSGVGVSSILLGIILQVWAIQKLGKFFTTTVQIKEGHQLIQSGPYVLLRHPSYTGLFLTFLGFGIFLESWIGLLITTLAMSIAYAIRIKAEEQTLINAFGEEYRKYQQVTFRLIPFIY